MVKVMGEIILKVPYSVDIDMKIKEFESLSEQEQDTLIEEAIDWYDAVRNAETNTVEVFDMEEV